MKVIVTWFLKVYTHETNISERPKPITGSLLISAPFFSLRLLKVYLFIENE